MLGVEKVRCHPWDIVKRPLELPYGSWSVALFLLLLYQHLICMFLWCIVKEVPVKGLAATGLSTSVHITVAF